MTPQTLTLIFVAAVGLVAIPAYDIWAATNDSTGDTISNVMASLSRYAPVLPFWWGIGGGHIFATAPPMLTVGGRVALLLWSSWLIMLLAWGGHLDVSHRWHVVVVLVAGVLVGALLLSQRHSYGLG